MKTAIAMTIIASMLALAACDSAGESPAPRAQGANELDKMIAQMETATVISRDLADSQARATTRADATRQQLVLQQQQTRIAGEALQTQTVFAANVAATASAQSVNTTATREAAFATATANTQNAIATSTRDAVIVEQTRASASATATAHAASAEQTRVTGAAIQTRAAEETQTIAAKQNWERTTESVRAVGMVIGVVLFVVGGLIVVGFVGYRSVTLLVQHRARQYRDANGELVVQLANGDFVRTVNMPGAYLPTSADRALPAGSQNDDVTRRAQAVSLALAGVTLDDDREGNEGGNAPTPSANWEIEQAFQSKPLPLHQQPSRLALPVGVTQSGTDLWVPLPTFAHALVAGTSGMGKTRLLHGWIAALAHGGKAEMILIDRKQGVEFARYANRPMTTYVEDTFVGPALERLTEEVERRNQLLRSVGATNVAEYNRTDGIPAALAHIVAVIDEIADLQDAENVTDNLIELARKARSSGVHLIFSTQNPDSKTIHPQILANAILRVAFSVPHHVNSVAILGCGGAQKLGGITGRMLVMYHGSLVPCQAYQIELPRPPMREIEPPDAPTALLEDARPQDDQARLNQPRLPDKIARMVQCATEQGGGWFKIKDIASALGVQTDEVNAAARWLEEQGLLTAVLKDERGYNAGRQISERLRALA